MAESYEMRTFIFQQNIPAKRGNSQNSVAYVQQNYANYASSVISVQVGRLHHWKSIDLNCCN